MIPFKSPLAKLIFITLVFFSGPFSFARDNRDHSEECPTNLGNLLQGKTIFGIANWGEFWVEYHTENGLTVLANLDLSDAKVGTWNNPSCLVTCYTYPDGTGWCPQWRQIEGGWYNISPGSGEIIHQIYSIKDGDVMGLMNLMPINNIPTSEN